MRADIRSRRGRAAKAVCAWLIAVVVVACSSNGSGSADSALALPARPAVPAGWIEVMGANGDLRIALPPDISAFETSGAVFANQPPPASGGEWIQLIAEGPRTAFMQPSPGESLDDWLERRWLAGEPSRGETLYRNLLLPAGRALELRTTLQPGTDHERAVILYAIRSPTGVAFLAIDGPRAEMEAHAADLALIPMLLELPAWRPYPPERRPCGLERDERVVTGVHADQLCQPMRARDRTVAHSPAPSAPTSSPVLGLAGIVGGAILLAALLVDIAPDLNPLRLVLFNVGAIAIVVAVHRRQASVAPALAALATLPALVANAWYLAMVVVTIGRSQPFGGDFALVWFVAGAGLWLADAAFGLLTLRLGVLTRWGALALTIGSVLAFTGIDRFGLSSPASPTIFGPLALAGVALNGIGWILLGIDVATRRRSSEGEPQQP